MPSLNFSGKIAKLFLENTPLAILFFVGTILVGILGYSITPKQYNPDIVMPVFEVSVLYPSAHIEEVERFVTKELEESIRDISGVDEIRSATFDGGGANVIVQFFVGEDVEESRVKLVTQLEDAHADQPYGIGDISVRHINPDDIPILTFGFTSEVLSQNSIREKVIALQDELRSVSGVANLSVHGGSAPAVTIFLHPDRLQFHGVSVNDVMNVIQVNNVRAIVGGLENGYTIQQVDFDAKFDEPKDLAGLQIAQGVTLEQVADIQQGYELVDEKVAVSTTSETVPAVFLSVAKRKGDNAITVEQELSERLQALLNDPAYKDLEVSRFRDEALVAKKAIQGLGMNLIISVFIVSLVVFLFLGKRSAIVIAAIIPLTLAWVFFIGWLFGENINRITLFALILSLGLLVDAATVVVENITKLMKEENKNTSVIHAVNQVGVGLVLSTVTSVIVFLPTSQVSGMMGEYMGPLSFFVPVALIVSLVMSFTLAPFLSRLFVKQEEARGWLAPFFDWLSEKYAQAIEFILRKKKNQYTFLGVVVGLLLIVFTFPLLRLVHFKMLPTADKNQFYVYIDAPVGTDLPQTALYTEAFIDEFVSLEAIDSIQQFVGIPPVIDFNGLFRGAEQRSLKHQATLRVNLVDTKDRLVTSEEIVQEVRAVLATEEIGRYYQQNQVAIQVVEDPPGPPVQSTFLAKVQGQNTQQMNKLSEALVAEMQQINGFVHIDTSVEEPALRAVYSFNHQKAQDAGVHASSYIPALQSVVDGLVVSHYQVENSLEQAIIKLEVYSESNDELQDLESIEVRNSSGELVPLISIVDIDHVSTKPVLYRDGGEETIYVSAEMNEKSIVYGVIDLISVLRKQETLNGFQLTSLELFGLEFQDEQGATYHVRWGGEFEMTLENFRDLGLAMIIAFLLIYVLLVAQYKSFTTPVLIMTTIPLAFIGILPGFALLDVLFGTFLTATSLIGFIALMGIVVNNAILYLEYFVELQERGNSIEEALVEAGKERLRPILLTSMTTILGSLTIVNDPVWSGLAWAIVFGLSLSAMLTLGVFPVMYVLANRSWQKK